MKGKQRVSYLCKAARLITLVALFLLILSASAINSRRIRTPKRSFMRMRSGGMGALKN